MKKQGNFEYEWADIPVNSIPPEELAGRVIERDFVIQLLAAGTVIQPIICTEYEGRVYLVDGRRRVLHSQHITQLKLEEITELIGDTDVLPEHFKKITAKVYKNIPPDAQKVWSLILNEQRSDNIIQTWITVRGLQREGKWEEIAKMHRLNKQRFGRFEQLNNLRDPDLWVQAFALGKVTEATVMAIAKLGGRQPFVEEILKVKGKVTMTDVKDAKTVSVAAAVAQRPFNMDTPITQRAQQQPNRQLFLVFDPVAGIPDNWGANLNECLARVRELGGNFKLYRLVEVG